MDVLVAVQHVFRLRQGDAALRTVVPPRGVVSARGRDHTGAAGRARTARADSGAVLGEKAQTLAQGHPRRGAGFQSDAAAERAVPAGDPAVFQLVLAQDRGQERQNAGARYAGGSGGAAGGARTQSGSSGGRGLSRGRRSAQPAGADVSDRRVSRHPLHHGKAGHPA